MLYATLRSIHLLAMIVWLGGMFYTLFCLRPSLGVLEPPPQRLRLMNAVLGRFFAVVNWAAGLILASGAVMMALTAHASATGARYSSAVSLMAALGIVMVLVYAHIRIVRYPRLQKALAAGDAATAVATLNGIRIAVAVNLAIGVAIVLITQFARLLP